MKKLLIILFIGILSINLNAQIHKGAILTGGYINFQGTDDSVEFPLYSSVYSDYYLKRKTQYAAINPQIGFFATESLLLGIGLTYEYSKHDQQNSYSNSYYSGSSSTFDRNNVILINPYLTKYSRLMDKLYFTTTINFLAGIGKEKSHQTNQDEYDELEANIFDLRINVTPGFTYFISEKWALSGSIGQFYYMHRREKLKTGHDLSEGLTNVENDCSVVLGFNRFTIGVQYYLNNKE